MMPVKTKHLGRYKDIARVLIRHGRGDLVRQAGTESPFPEDEEGGQEAPAEAKELADDLERLGPTFIKLGQLLSTRADLLPPAYLEALSRLQDKVEPFASDEVQRIVRDELGVKTNDVFSEFEPRPFASASLGQVHRAALRDGRPVAVKVQRPGIRQQAVEDLEALADLAEFVDSHTDLGRRYGLARLLGEFRRSLLDELDYRKEAANMVTLGRNLQDFDRIVVPQPVKDLTSGRVLVMEFVKGRKVTSLSPLARMEMDGAELAEQLFRSYLKQILEDGFFHADPHPGNVFVTDSGQLALLDLGMVARVAPEAQDLLVKLLLAVSEGRGQQAADVTISLGERLPDFDEETFRRGVAEIVSRNLSATVQELDAGRVVVEINRVAGQSALRLPAELSLLGKALLNLDQVAHVLNPDFEPASAVRDHLTEIMRGRLTHSTTPGSALYTVMEAKEFLERLPGRVNKFMDAALNGELTLHVDAFDEKELMRGFQKVANRVTTGLILAALIIGAALLMQVDTSAKILGYPALAIVLFLMAAAGGTALVLDIVLTDRRSRKR